MEKVNIKTLKDLNKLKIGETYEIEEWGLEPEIIEEIYHSINNNKSN